MKLKQLLNIEFPTYIDAIAALTTDRFAIVIPQELSFTPLATIDPELDMLPRCGGMFDIHRIDLRLQSLGQKWQLRVDNYNLPTYMSIDEALERECDPSIVDRLEQTGYYTRPPVNIRGTYLEDLFETIAETHEDFSIPINKLFIEDPLLDTDRRTEVEGDFLLATYLGIFVGFVNQTGYHPVIIPRSLANAVWDEWKRPMKYLVDSLQLEDRSGELRRLENKRDILARHARKGYFCWKVPTLKLRQFARC